MNTIIIIGIVQCLFLTVLVINKKNRGFHDIWLAIFLVFNALHLLFFWANFNSEYSKYQFVLVAGSGFPLLSGPLLFIYVSALVNKQPMPFKYLFIHFTPFIIFCLSFYYYLLFRSDMEGIQVYDGFLHPYGNIIWPLRNISIFFAISAGVYPIWALLLLRKHTRNLYDVFSYFEKINLNWIKYWIIFILISFLIAFLTILFIVDFNSGQNHIIAFKIVALIITVQIFIVGYYGFKQTTIFSNINLPGAPIREFEKPREEIEKYASSKLDAETAEAYKTKLLEIMKSEKPYLNNELSIRMLSEIVDISNHTLSQILNDQIGKNFFDFVNEYRVDAVITKMKDGQNNHLTLLGIAYDSGFNSKSSFNSIFKKLKGKTPSQFKKSLF